MVAPAAAPAATGGGLSFGQTAALMGLGGGIGLAGSYMAGQQSYKATKKLIAWQDILSRTQYQRAVADLRAAGLNPALAVTGLKGAPVPGGATPTIPDYGKSTLEGMANATALKGMISQTKKMEAEAGISQVERTLDEKALKLLNEDERIRNIVLGGRLAGKAGIPGQYGALITAISEALKMRDDRNRKLKKPQRQSLTNKEIDDIIKKYVPDGMVP